MGKAVQEEIDMDQSTKKGQYKRTRYKMDIYKERGKRKISIQSQISDQRIRTKDNFKDIYSSVLKMQTLRTLLNVAE